MAHFYPGTLLEISCYHIYALSSSLACILIKFVQSAVFTIGDPGFLFLFPFTLFYLFPPFPLLYLLICSRVYRWACLF